MKKPPDRDEIEWLEQWLQKGENDLITAKLLIMRPEAPLEALGFHAQQAAEKYLKALLVHLGIDFPRTHNLRLLVQLLPAGVSLDGVDLEKMFSLNQFAVDERYPGDDPILTKEMIEEALGIAEAVKVSVLTTVKGKD